MGKVIINLCLAGLFATGTAQAANIYGRVYDTLKGQIYRNVRIELGTQPPRQTTTDELGQYWFRGVEPGAYLIRILRSDDEEVVGRLVVSPKLPTTVGNLDLSKIEAPHQHDEY